MIQKSKTHIIYYLALFTIVMLGIIFALHMAYSRQGQMLIVVVTTFFYVLLGIVHHKANHDLTAKIVIEYMLIGALGMTIVSFFLNGAL